MVAKLIDCSDFEFYGILEVKNVDEKTVQNKIIDIKEKFYEDGFEDWSIEDVLNEFPEEWEWEYHLACEFEEITI